MKKTKIQILLFSFGFLFLMNVNAQDGVIQLDNPSFEDYPAIGKTPSGWRDCGVIDFPLETPPNIFPYPEPRFGVNTLPKHGGTYLGMVTRKNNSWESIAQELSSPLQKDSCYALSFYLCKSPTFSSHTKSSRGRMDKADFTTPIKLRIWAGKNYCDKGELLAESSLVENIEWQNYIFYFQPKQTNQYIILEAFFQTPTIEAPNGNIMVDGGSPILLVSCNATEVKKQLAKFEEKQKDFEIENEVKVKFKNTSKERLQEYEDKAMTAQIRQAAKDVKFQSNRLTTQGMLSIAWISNSIINNPNHKLIIDFGGIRERNFNKRKESIETILKNELLPEANYEIINSREERENVKWIVEESHFYIGVVKNN
ncbi:MAG: hypothetical protein AB8H03_22325 [Saprospiraceae bacterium]